jgi:hypothetical protein
MNFQPNDKVVCVDDKARRLGETGLRLGSVYCANGACALSASSTTRCRSGTSSARFTPTDSARLRKSGILRLPSFAKQSPRERIAMNDAILIEIFEEAFSSLCSGARRTCACGKTFYNGSGHWDWDDGEIEELEKNGATPVDYSIGGVIFQGVEYANACTCWHPMATKAIGFIIQHDRQIADFLNKRRERTIAQANYVASVTT